MNSIKLIIISAVYQRMFNDLSKKPKNLQCSGTTDDLTKETRMPQKFPQNVYCVSYCASD